MFVNRGAPGKVAWEGYHRLIPAEQLFTGKDLTFAPYGSSLNRKCKMFSYALRQRSLRSIRPISTARAVSYTVSPLWGGCCTCCRLTRGLL